MADIQEFRFRAQAQAEAEAAAEAEAMQSPDSFGTNFKNNLVSAADAAMLGFADEGAAALRSVLPGYGSYESELGAIRGGMEQHAAKHPYQAIASALIGAAVPAVASAGSAGPAATGSLLKATTGAAKTGAAYGGAYGYGSGEGGYENRIASALLGTLGGGATGAVLAPLAYGGARLAQGMAGSGERALGSEAGAILPKQASAALRPEEIYLAKRLTGVPVDTVKNASDEMASALAEGSPMWLPEAVESPSVARLTRFLAGYEPSMDTVQNAVVARKGGALDRVSGILDEVSTERSPVLAGENVQGTIEGIKDVLIKKRAADAKPLYDKLHKSNFVSDEVKSLLSNDRVKQAIKAVRKDFPEFKERGDSSFEILDSAKQWLYGESVKAANPTEKRFIDGVRSKLVAAMDKEKPVYKEARATFEEESIPLNLLFGNNKRELVTLLRSKPEHVGDALLGLDKSKLAEIGKTFGPDKAGNLKDAVRAALQKKVEGKKENLNLVSDFVDVPATRDKLRVIIDDDVKFERLMSLLRRENKYAKAANLYNPGSTTHGNFSEDAALSKGVNVVQKLMAAVKNPSGASLELADYLVRRNPKGDTARALAQILTDTKAGSDTIAKLIPYLESASKNRATAQAAGQVLGSVGGSDTTVLADKLTR